MAAVLGTRENPIKLSCADIKGSNDKIDECVVKIIQRKNGLNQQVFKDKRRKYVAFVVKTNNCHNCSLGMNTCKVVKIVLPKKAIEEKMAVVM